MSPEDAFAALAMAPTTDGEAVKRAYFAALAKAPPHADPEGFRRVRKAYELLSDPGRRTLAFLRAPVAAQTELARWEQRWGAQVSAAQREAQAVQQASRAVALFIERLMRLRPEDVLRADPAEPQQSG